MSKGLSVAEPNMLEQHADDKSYDLNNENLDSKEHDQRVSQSSSPARIPLTSKRALANSDDSFVGVFCGWIVEHQIGR